MSNFFGVLMILAMLATVLALLVGVFSMAKGGAFAQKYGNKIMWARIYTQGAALAFFVLALLARASQ